ncbi:MAG: glycoside hydrolase family 95 protein, partial [Marinilabiliales bacterium]|nr:glycoside hydrolase family 95 protein [Marinilabiliales bacterium]
MKKLVVACMILLPLTLIGKGNSPELWYKQPARNWTEALPVGNGRLGAMVFGDVHRENIQLNEESLWAGVPMNNNNPEAAAHLDEIRQAIFDKQFGKALEMSNKYMVGTPPRIRSYQPLGNLFLDFGKRGEPTQYRRSLHLADGLSLTAYTVDQNSFRQEVFVSAPQDLLSLQISAGKPFDLDLVLSRGFDPATESKGNAKKAMPTDPPCENHYGHDTGSCWFTGQVIDPASPLQGPAGKHMRYAAMARILVCDGQAQPYDGENGAGFHLRGVKGFTLILTGATDYQAEKMELDATADPLQICRGILEKASVLPVKKLKENHIRDHGALFNRVELSLGGEPDLETMATDERLARMKEGKTDNGLLSLYFQYGRYLLMNSSRAPGKLPANLQGIWNDLYQAPWNADFHTNINLQMNYWPAEVCNLSETVDPLSAFMGRVAIKGAVTARETYHARGWTMHHLTDPFGSTGVMDGVWGITPLDGPWMTFPLFDHYAYTMDETYLREVAYPLIKGAVLFALDYLVLSPEGYLVTNPSHSPENSFYVPNTNKKESSQLCYAPTVDIHILNALFNNFTQAAGVLKLDAELAAKVKEAQRKLPPLKVTPIGTLQEWMENYEEVDPGHRHISHLLGLYPLHLITPKEPVYFEAAKKTLAR